MLLQWLIINFTLKAYCKYDVVSFITQIVNSIHLVCYFIYCLMYEKNTQLIAWFIVISMDGLSTYLMNKTFSFLLLNYHFACIFKHYACFLLHVQHVYIYIHPVKMSIIV